MARTVVFTTVFSLPANLYGLAVLAAAFNQLRADGNEHTGSGTAPTAATA